MTAKANDQAYGVVLFDPQSKTLKSDSERYGPREWATWSTLPTDVVWLTNISPLRFFKKPSYARRHLRSNEYLGARTETILTEFCALDAPIERKLSILRGVMERVHALAGTHFDCAFSDDDYLYHAVQARLVCVDPSAFGLEFEQAGIELNIQEAIPAIANNGILVADEKLEHADQQVECYGETDRLVFLNEIEQCLSPTGAWREHRPDHFGATVWNQIRTLSRLDRPVLSMVRLVDLFEPVERITRNAVRPGARRWVTHEELMFLANFATIAIERVFVAERYVRLPGILSTPLPLLEGHQMQSISIGLLAQNVVLALCSPVIQNGLMISTARMAWCLTHFRLKRLRACILAGESLGQVLEYSATGVRWATREENVHHSIMEAHQVGLRAIVKTMK